MILWTLRLSALAALLFIGGPLLARIGILPPFGGFVLFALGGLLAVVTDVIGTIAFVRGGPNERVTLIQGLGPAVIIALIFLYLASRGAGVPRINDITTDTEKPPQFVHALTLPANQDRDMSYPGASFAEQQRAGYGVIAPVVLQMPADQAFVKAKAAAETMRGWTLTKSDAETRTIEGYDTSALFRFSDDFVIEIRDKGGSSEVHMRSKSRSGKGDVGANAARIRAYFEKLTP